MKARFTTKAALCALAFMFAGALSGVAQQTVSPAAASVAATVKASPAEKGFMQKMAGIVQAGQKSGSLDMKAVSALLDSAAKARVSDPVMGAMVAMAAGTFPSQAPQIAAAAVKSYGPRVTEAQVRNVVASTVAVQPKPYASVSPICAAVTKALGNNSLVANTVPAIAVSVASQTPDNPLQGVTTQTQGTLAKPGEDSSGGALVLPGGISVGGTPTSADPVSDPAGN